LTFRTAQDEQEEEEETMITRPPPPPSSSLPSPPVEDESAALKSHIEELEMLRVHSDRMWKDAEKEVVAMRREVDSTRRDFNVRRICLVTALNEVEHRVAKMEEAVIRTLMAITNDPGKGVTWCANTSIQPGDGAEEEVEGMKDILGSVRDPDMSRIIRRLLQRVAAVGIRLKESTSDDLSTCVHPPTSPRQFTTTTHEEEEEEEEADNHRLTFDIASIAGQDGLDHHHDSHHGSSGGMPAEIPQGHDTEEGEEGEGGSGEMMAAVPPVDSPFVEWSTAFSRPHYDNQWKASPPPPYEQRSALGLSRESSGGGSLTPSPLRSPPQFHRLTPPASASIDTPEAVVPHRSPQRQQEEVSPERHDVSKDDDPHPFHFEPPPSSSAYHSPARPSSLSTHKEPTTPPRQDGGSSSSLPCPADNQGMLHAINSNITVFSRCCFCYY